VQHVILKVATNPPPPQKKKKISSYKMVKEIADLVFMVAGKPALA